MAYDIVETIKGDTVQRQFRTLEHQFEKVLTIDIEAGDKTDESKINLAPSITMEVFSDDSAWDVEHALVLRVGSNPYRFVWLTGDLEEFLLAALNDIGDDLNGIQHIHLIEGDTRLVEAIQNSSYDVVGQCPE